MNKRHMLPIIFLSLISFTYNALAHGEYTLLKRPGTDISCCNEKDCAPIAEERVKEVTGGFLIDNKHFVPYKEVIPSWDGDYHACFWPKPDDLRCFIAPIGGF